MSCRRGATRWTSCATSTDRSLRRIYAEGGNFTHGTKEIIDNIVATIRFRNGAVASVVQGDSGQTPFVSKFSFQVTDGRKTAHLRNRLKSVTFFDGENASEVTDPEEYGFPEENRDFIRSLISKTPPRSRTSMVSGPRFSS